jgi:hypothetical protein
MRVSTALITRKSRRDAGLIDKDPGLVGLAEAATSD